MGTGEAPFDASRVGSGSGRIRAGRVGEPGLVIDGRYRLEQLLGAGGFGEVWRARQEVEGAEIRPVALKLLYAADAAAGTPPLATGRTAGTGAGSSSGGAHSWLDEVRAVRDVRCESIATIFDVGISRSPRVAFIAMELLSGETLDQRLRRGPLHWRRALVIARRVASALQACHRVDVVHCDLKPQNVFLGADGEVYVLDFGVAALGGRTVARPLPAADPAAGYEPGVTGAVSVDEMPGVAVPAAAEMQIVGTPGYIAPESFLGEAPGAASDAFALGVVIYRAIAGRLPHRIAAELDPTSTRTTSTADGQQRYQAALHAATIRGDLVPLAEAMPGVPDAVGRLVASLLAVEPAARPVRGLVDAIDEVMRRPWGVPDPPYVGLAAFDAHRAGYIAGRDGDIEEVTAVLRRSRVVFLTGPSGCGKSSLAIAGVSARIDEQLVDGADGWELVTLRPSQGAAVVRPAPAAGEAPRAAVGTVVVIDQMEEVIRLDDAGRVALCTAIADLAEGTGPVEIAGRVLRPTDPVRLIATVRDDLFGRVASQPELRRIPERNLFTVRGVEPNAMTEIVEGPARAAGFALEGGAEVVAEATRIVGEDPGALPLVQFALTRWWEGRDPVRRVLPRQVWVDIGGIEGALAEAAQTLYDGMGEPERAAMRALLLALFRPDGTRVRVMQAELVRDATSAQVLGRLVDRRLVTRHTGDEGGTTLEVVHEALGRRWPLLHQWLEETRTERELLHDVRYDAERWRKAGRPPDLLWRGGRLAAVQELGDRLADAAEFVAAADKAQRGQAWTRRGFIGLLAAVVVVAVVVTLSYLASNRERERARQAQEVAEEERGRAEQARGEAEQALARNIDLRRQAENSRAEAVEQKRQADIERRAADEARVRAQREAELNAELRRQAEGSRAEAVSARDAAQKAMRQAQTEKAEADRQRDLNRQFAEQAEKQRREAEIQRRYAETAQRLHELARKRMERIEGEYEALRAERRELLRKLEQYQEGKPR